MDISSIQSLSAPTQNLAQNGAVERLGVSSSSTASPVGHTSPIADSFGDLIQHFVSQSNQAQKAADNSISEFVTGKSDNIQDVAISMANAEMSFKFFLEIRNKVIDSFNELMRMPF